ncbi:unnamed protein product [Linum tenue]|uniref:Non-haem dioxygenase N-terminal domain-containing protein n=1 Tax=Linum tenue TaxID=586396 RepID=A0AAV0MDB2_9ROSI|nr:unnamed protein product [Linum tenue]
MVVPTAASGGDQQKPYEIPFFELCVGGNDVVEGGRRWRELCDKVREACETHGCFCFSTERIPSGLRQGMVEGLRQLFELPEDTKKRHVNPKPYRSYLGKNDAVPYLESFGIDHAPNLEQARAFTTLMWPQGNPSFCNKDDSTVAVADQLVDGDHPLMYRPFTYSDYLSYFVHNLSDDALEVYAGLSSPVVGIAPT